MKDFFLILAAILVSATLASAVIDYRVTCAEMAQIETITDLSNRITDDDVAEALNGLSDEELTEKLGL
ncbi:MAG: hypothetical protein EOM59_19915 [Clostridia bacterium]|nr:hypothetical protein [Clostridia bacterium]